MKVGVTRVRHPLACFKGEISVSGEKTATAEEIKLAFNYFPVIDGQVGLKPKEVVQNGNGKHVDDSHQSNGSNQTEKNLSSRFVRYDPAN